MHRRCGAVLRSHLVWPNWGGPEPGTIVCTPSSRPLIGISLTLKVFGAPWEVSMNGAPLVSSAGPFPAEREDAGIRASWLHVS
eukprot:1997575-Pyramimonas_sp.AAC.1